MVASSVNPGDLLDLKLMPAWVKEPSAREDYADYPGEQPGDRPERSGRRPRERERARPDKRPPLARSGPRDKQRHGGRDTQRHPKDFRRQEQPPAKPEQPLDMAVQFVPRSAVLDNVIGQVKAETLAYSLFFLARSFLEKPQRYQVAVKTKLEKPLYRLGEVGPVSTDRALLESNAFGLAREQFYRTEITQSEPLKGNFTSIARCRLSSTVLGPTNHHDYQRKLRGLYEQRFSRRMNFAEYQRQIEIVNDPAAIEHWKEEARTQTTYITLHDEPPLTFATAGDAERHFRQHHLPGLIRLAEEVTIDGVTSRELGDRRLRGHIEQAWSVENGSPSRMMQELAKRFRDAGLHIFRHRRGMLFVSSIRVRPFVHDEESVSAQVKAILELVTTSPRIRRKEVGDKLLAEAGEELETRRLSLASDLRWLISEGYLIEFNDGALDLPRVKTKKAGEQPRESDLGPESQMTGGLAAEGSDDLKTNEVPVLEVDAESDVEEVDPNRHRPSQEVVGVTDTGDPPQNV
jgi:hypothetical protein